MLYPTNLLILILQQGDGAETIATCPNCGTEVSKPDKVFSNIAFHLESCACPFACVTFTCHIKKQNKTKIWVKCSSN